MNRSVLAWQVVYRKLTKLWGSIPKGLYPGVLDYWEGLGLSVDLRPGGKRRQLFNEIRNSYMAIRGQVTNDEDLCWLLHVDTKGSSLLKTGSKCLFCGSPIFKGKQDTATVLLLPAQARMSPKEAECHTPLSWNQLGSRPGMTTSSAPRSSFGLYDLGEPASSASRLSSATPTGIIVVVDHPACANGFARVANSADPPSWLVSHTSPSDFIGVPAVSPIEGASNIPVARIEKTNGLKIVEIELMAQAQAAALANAVIADEAAANARSDIASRGGTSQQQVVAASTARQLVGSYVEQIANDPPRLERTRFLDRVRMLTDANDVLSGWLEFDDYLAGLIKYLDVPTDAGMAEYVIEQRESRVDSGDIDV